MDVKEKLESSKENVTDDGRAEMVQRGKEELTYM